jgi:hypothetical protein
MWYFPANFLMTPEQFSALAWSLIHMVRTPTSYHLDSVEGSGWDVNSYHAELKGILVDIEFTNQQGWQIQVLNGQCSLYCDSEGALSAAFDSKQPTPWWTSFDLVMKIRQATPEFITHYLETQTCKRTSGWS